MCVCVTTGVCVYVSGSPVCTRHYWWIVMCVCVSDEVIDMQILVGM